MKSRATTVEPEHVDLPPEFPPGVNPWDYLAGCYADAWGEPGRLGCTPRNPCDQCGACYRRAVTRHNPIAFSVTYLSHLFKRYPNADGVPVWSFCDLHLDMADIGLHWSVPGPHRDALFGPRDSAKSLGWIELVVWALAHGHRRYALAFSATREQIIPQIADVRRALRGRLLLADFPDLAVRRGPGSRDTMTHVTTGAGTVVGRGLGDSVYGLREEDTRPEIIVFDDADLDAVKMSPQEKIKLLARIRGILPMNLDAAVLVVGVPTMPGCLAHDIVRHAQRRPGLLPDRGRWINDLNFRAHYWPAILDEGHPMKQRSLWPQKWSLGRLLGMAKRDPIGFAFDYRGDPSGAAAVRLWTPESYVYAPRGMRLRRRALSIDGAVTRKATSDRTAITVGGVAHEGAREVVIEHAEMGRITAHELQTRIWTYAEMYPETLDTVLIDGTNGGELWREVLEPWPDSIEWVIVYSLTGHKRARIEALHRRYTRVAVLHATRLPELEDQQCAWVPPATAGRDTQADDLLDSESGLVRWFLDGWPGDEVPPDVAARIAAGRLGQRDRGVVRPIARRTR